MSLKNKLIYIVTTLIVLPMFIMGFVTYRQLRHERIQKELRNVNFAIERKNQFLQYFLNDFKSQVLIFANTPPIQGIIRSRESGVDYMDNSSLEQWKNRWRNIALITLQEKPYIAQIRLINGEGQEVIRVERDKKDNIINIPEEELQEKSGRYYFTETMRLPKDAVYISSIDLNEEQGQIEIPHNPVIRFATPVFDERNGRREGIVIFNVRAEELLKYLQSADIGDSFLLDQDGYFLVHPDRNKIFGRQLNHSHNYFQEYPEAISQGVFSVGTGSYYDSKEKSFWISQRIYYTDQYKNQFWVLITRIKEDVLFAQVIELRKRFGIFLVCTVLVSSMIAWLFGVSLITPIQKLAESARRISKGDWSENVDDKLKISDGEIGDLVHSFKEMIEKVTTSREELVAEVEERKSAEDRFRQLIEKSPYGILLVDTNGKIKLANEQIEKYFGYSREDLMDQAVEKLIPNRFQSKHLEYRKEYSRAPTPRKMGAGRDLFGLTKDGTELPVEIGLIPIRVQGEMFVLANIIDISERKKQEMIILSQTENLKRSNQELEQFAYVASHDLQEPIRKIIGFTQLFARNFEGRMDEESEEYMNFIIDGARRMQVLIQDLLQYSRAGKKELEFEETDLNVVVEDAVKNLNTVIQDAQAEIHSDKLPVVQAHRVFILQLFQNLINNAIKYRSEDKPCINIAAKPKGSYWEFSVEDNGIGIQPEYAEKIFKIFQRLHGRDEYSGTGIGLTICRRIVGRHGGRIWLDVENDHKGSIFKFILPMKYS